MEHTVRPSSQLILITKLNRSEIMSQSSSGIISALAAYVDHPQIISINADNDLEELAASLHITLDRYPKIDLIFSIESLTTKVVQAVTRSRQRPIPTYFIGVIDPVGCGFVKSLDEPGSYITGTSVLNRDYDEQVEGLLYATGQSFTHAIVPSCNLGDDLRTDEKELDRMVNALKRRNISVTTVSLTYGEDIIEKIKPLLSQADIICIPRDTLIMEYASTFIKMANERGIPLFTSDSDSVIQGAAIGFGSPAYEFTREVSMWAQPLLLDGCDPATFPVAVYSHWKGHIIINKEAAEKQNLSIDMNSVFAQEKCKTALW